MSRKQKWQENLLVHPNAPKSNQKKRRRQPAHPGLGLPKQTVADRGQKSTGSTSSSNSSSLNTSSSVSCSSMNANSGGSGSKSIKKSSISCIACSTENISDVARGNSSGCSSHRNAGGAYGANGLNSCRNKGSNSINTGGPTTSAGVKGSGASEYSGKNRRDTVTAAVEVSSPLPSSVERGLQEEEVELRERGGVLLDSNSSTSSPCTSSVSSCLSSPLSQPTEGSSTNDDKDQEGVESGYSSLEKTRSDTEDTQTGCDTQYRRSQVIEEFEKKNGMDSHANEAYSSSSSSSASEHDHEKRASRSTVQVLGQNHNDSSVMQTSASTGRRSKSLERNLAEYTSTPDLLNFKKGWMTRLEEDGKWRKHWFVLTDQSLRFYRDSVAEEAADLDGEINLSTCYDITDYPVQRNYGFQIHTKDGVFTLCAMTYGIRRKWIQAVMKNVRPTVAPDVTSPVQQKASLSPFSGTTVPSSSNMSCEEVEKRSRISERRKEGRYKTFDWAEFRHRQQKWEGFGRKSQSSSEPTCVPPAPASSPEEPIITLASEKRTETRQSYLPERTLYLQTPHLTVPTELPNNSLAHADASVISEHSMQGRGGDGAGNFSGIFNPQVETKREEKKTQSATPSPATYSSSVQTEWEWEAELQTLRSELKSEHERSEKEVREFKLSEARLQAELKNGQDRLHEMESRLQKAEAILMEKDNALEELHRQLEDAEGRLKSTEEAQALKDVRLERHLRLLQESQERERKSLSDSLDHAERRRKELEEQLQQMEAELQNVPIMSRVEEWERKCQELQNQLEESDCEVGRLQARLQNEETLYYDMEHDYERVCEELECARGALQDSERVCEERFGTQLEQQQQELDKKERELQEVLVKMAALGTSLEQTERRLKEARSHVQKGCVIHDRLNEGQDLFSSSVGGQELKNGGPSGTETKQVAQGDESERVISVIQALESKLSDTEERLREITMHLQQQQKHRALSCETLRDMQKTTDCLSAEATLDDRHGRQGGQALRCLQGMMLERTNANTGVNMVTNGMIYSDLQRDLKKGRERPENCLPQGMISRILSLEALVIQRMASALEHPSRELLHKLSELQVQARALREAQDVSHEKTLTENNLHFFSCYQELDEASGLTQGQIDICRLCVRAELAYHTYTLHTHNSEEQQGSDTFNPSPWSAFEVPPPGTREEKNSKRNSGLADISPPELAPYSEQIQKGPEEEFCSGETELQCTGSESLARELRLQAQTLQTLSIQLQPEDDDLDMLSEVPPAVLQTVLSRATLAYVTSRLHLVLQQELCILREQRERAMCECRAVCRSMEALFQEQTKCYEEKLREGRVVIEMAELGRVSAETDAQMQGQEVHRLEAEFEEKLQKLQRIHEEEMTRLHGYYMQSRPRAMTPSGSCNGDENGCVSAFKERIRELEGQISCLEDELHSGDANSLRQAYEQELETLKATCELGFSSMEQSHQRVIEELQRQHLIEVERLTEEREKVLQEETNATIAAIEAMRKAHKEELEKSQKCQQNGANTDISKMQVQFNEELDSLHRELEVLSEQYSQKCLENAHLSRTIETEREALNSTERENQELHTRNYELNKHLVSELSLIQSCMNGGVDHALIPQGKDIYQLEVTLRVKESEIQCLKQEISSLKEELQAANRHSKEHLNELSVLGAKCPSDCAKHRAEPYRHSYRYDSMKSRSNPDFMRERSKRKQPARSKSLRDGLSVQERMKLFELEDNRKS